MLWKGRLINIIMQSIMIHIITYGSESKSSVDRLKMKFIEYPTIMQSTNTSTLYKNDSFGALITPLISRTPYFLSSHFLNQLQMYEKTCSIIKAIKICHPPISSNLTIKKNKTRIVTINCISTIDSAWYMILVFYIISPALTSFNLWASSFSLEVSHLMFS